jgi:hypothetical protein
VSVSRNSLSHCFSWTDVAAGFPLVHQGMCPRGRHRDPGEGVCIVSTSGRRRAPVTRREQRIASPKPNLPVPIWLCCRRVFFDAAQIEQRFFMPRRVVEQPIRPICKFTFLDPADSRSVNQFEQTREIAFSRENRWRGQQVRDKSDFPIFIQERVFHMWPSSVGL